jgi:hypothetical protein
MLLAAVAESKWREAILEGFSHAAMLHGDRAWTLPLWRYWREPHGKGKKQEIRYDLRDELVAFVPRAEVEEYIATLLAQPTAGDNEDCGDMLAALPGPWSAELGAAYLAALRAFVAGLTDKSKDASPWSETLDSAATALPAECFVAGLDPIELPDTKFSWYMQNFQRQLDAFADVIRLRQRVREEIPA